MGLRLFDEWFQASLVFSQHEYFLRGRTLQCQIAKLRTTQYSLLNWGTTGHYSSPGGCVQRTFCCDNGASTSPLKAKAYIVVLILKPCRWTILWSFPSSIPATTKKPVLLYACKWHLYLLNTYLEQQFHIFDHQIVWARVSVKGYSSHPNRWKHSHCRSRPPHCRVLPRILHPPFPVTFIFSWPHDSSVFTDSLMCRYYNDIE